MSKIEMQLHLFDLRLKHTFKIAHDIRDVQKTLIVEIKSGEHSGFGEATASNFYSNSIEEMVEVLENNRSKIESYNFQPPEAFWEDLKEGFSKNSFAQSAVDVAIHDLYAKSKGTSLMHLWGERGGHPISNYTIGIDTIENMAMKLKEFPWSCYKIKLGTSEDLKIISELRKLTHSTFRVDANCGWGVEDTLLNATAMKSLGVEFIEQPLKPDDWDGMKVLFDKSELPIMADESIVGEADVEKCSTHFHGINVKLMKCGGFTPARRMIKQAKSFGMKVMVGCMTESSVGISAIAQLLPTLDYVDMDGFLLLENDIAHGPLLENGKIKIASGDGIGIITLDNTL